VQLAPIKNSCSVTSKHRHGKGKIMARPKKEQDLKHTHRIYLRLTDTEYEVVSTNAKTANLTLAEYARKQLNESIADIFEMRCEVLKLAGDFQQIRKL